MAEESNYQSLEGKRVSTTFRGLLHLPHSLDSVGTKEIVYDGQGKATALTLGSSALDVGGTLNVTKATTLSDTLSVTKATTLSDTLNVTKATTLSDTLNVTGNVGIGTVTQDSKLHVNGAITLDAETVTDTNSDVSNRSNVYIKFNPAGSVSDWAYLRQIGTNNNFHLALDMHDDPNGPNSQSFSIRNVNSNANPDTIQTLFTADGTTGQVTIKNLTVSNITNVPDPTLPVIPNRPPNRNMNILPVGMICMFPNVKDVDGWLKCDGTLYDGNTYGELFEFLGNDYGGTAPNFKVPDYRELFLRGWGTSINRRNIDPDVTASQERLPAGTIQEDEIKSHAHGIQNPPGSAFIQGDNGGSGLTSGSRNGTTSSYGGPETRPKNIAVAYYIKW